MDPLSLCIALGPLAVYVLLLGLIHFGSRPFLTSGARDGAALAIAVSGFAIVGPLRLFVPEPAIYRFGWFVWVMLLALYALGATLLVLLMRPRLVVYNVSVEQLRPVLASAVQELDDTARWAGDSLLLPKLGVQLYLESFPLLRNVQIVSAGPEQNYSGWRRLESEMHRGLRTLVATPSPRGASLVVIALAITLIIAYSMVMDQVSVAQAFSELIRFQ